MLSAYENLLPARRFNSTYVSVGGHGGEVALRDSFETGPVSWEMAAAVLENYYLTTPEIFRPEAFGDHKAFLRDWLAAERASGASPNIALDRFAVRFDLGVSGIGPTVTEIGRYGLYPLMDNQVTKAGFQARQDVKQRDDLLINLLARLAPQLLDVPFAYKRWNFEREGPRPGDEAGWARRAPITAPAAQRATFNWRHRWAHELYDTFYEQVFGDARAEAMFEVLDREALRAWFGKRRGTTDPNGASVAWAAYSASVMLSNDWLDPDAPGTGEITIPLPPTS